MFHDFNAGDFSAPLDHSLPGTAGELLSELGLSGRAIREILPDAAPPSAPLDTEEFE